MTTGYIWGRFAYGLCVLCVLCVLARYSWFMTVKPLEIVTGVVVVKEAVLWDRIRGSKM